MQRLPKIALLALLVFLLVLLAAWGVQSVYMGYTAQIARIAELESRVEKLKGVSHPPWMVREDSFRISTTDRPSGTNWNDFRLDYGSNALQKFEGFVSKEPGHILTAWVSDWSPRSEMEKFERFDVTPVWGTSKFEVFAKAHTNASISMEFTLTFIDEEK